MGRKRRNMKNIIAIAAVITVVMAIVLIAFSSSASAESFDRNYTDIGGVLWYEGNLIDAEKPNKAGKILNVYEGEKILFLNKGLNNKSVAVTVSGPCESDGDWEDDYDDYSVSKDQKFDTSGKSTGYYVIKEELNSEVGGWFNLRKHSIEVELVGEKEKVQEGKNFSIRIKKGENARLKGVMKLTIEDEEEYSIMNVNNKDIYEILVAYKDKEDFTGSAVTQENESVEGISVDDVNGTLVFETAKLKMEEGEYTIILEDYATEADDVFIVTSADYLSIYAANNICKGINRHASREGSPLGGIVYNVRGAIDDLALVEEFAQSVGSKVIGAIPNDPTIMENEIYAKTTVEYKPESKIAGIFRDLATAIYENKETVSPTPLSKVELAGLAQRIRQKTREAYKPEGA
ncbi:MAG: hypothetical protein WBC40_05775 [Halobacteriota archaeon]